MVPLAGAVLALPLALTAERDILHFPAAEEFRLQRIARAGNEAGWPFSVEGGYLACVWAAGDRVTLFVEDGDGEDGDGEAARRVVLTANPFDLAILNMGQRALFASFDGLGELVERIAPYVATARRLCDQPPGTRIEAGEL